MIKNSKIYYCLFWNAKWLQWHKKLIDLAVLNMIHSFDRIFVDEASSLFLIDV